MFKKLVEFFKEMKASFRETELEVFIRSRNPQIPGEVDALEREFYRTRPSSIFDKYY